MIELKKNILNLLTHNKLDYNNIIKMCYTHIPNKDRTDINFIIPVRNRVEFGKIMYNSFLRAKENSDLKVSYTIVEVSHVDEHKDYCVKNNINYIWYKTDVQEPFNKCLGLNLGALLSNKSNSFLFHDIDCLIQSDFFNKLNENIINKKAKAIQCFQGRRVLYLNQELTNQAIGSNLDIDTLSLGNPGVSLPEHIGAPGGSIYADKDIFFNVGGYDPEFFHGYAPEDIFFWNKVNLIDTMYTSDDPEIDIFHMNHSPTVGTNPHIQQMLSIDNAFNQLSVDDKLDLINIKSNFIKEFYYE